MDRAAGIILLAMEISFRFSIPAVVPRRTNRGRGHSSGLTIPKAACARELPFAIAGNAAAREKRGNPRAAIRESQRQL
jgi:hypothetical protein